MLLFRYSNIEYLMNKPFEQGFEIIQAGIERHSDKQLENIYFFGTSNGYQEKYNTLFDFKTYVKTTSQQKPKTASEIMSEVESIIKSFK